MHEMEGAADFLIVADPATFRVLPWAPDSGWVLCDLYFADGRPVPFDTRRLLRLALDPALDLIPEISGNRLMVSIRLMRLEADDRLHASNEEAAFELTLCS